MYEQGKTLFLSSTMKGKKAPSPALSQNDTDKGDTNKQNEKLPVIVLACAFAQFLAAFSFTCMTSMTGLVWMILFSKFFSLFSS